jgi:hypothetical protein
MQHRARLHAYCPIRGSHAEGFRRPNSGSVGSTRGASDERGDDVGGVAIQGLASSVVAHGGAWVSVASSFLDVTQWNSGVERNGDDACRSV